MSGSHSLSLKMKNQHATQKKSNRGRHSLYLMMKTSYAVQKISNAEKAKSIIDNNEQFCSADQMSSLSLTMNNSSAMQNYFLARRHCLSLRRRTIMRC